MICKEHGKFYPTPNNHLRGTGYDDGYSVEQTTDRGYVITGYSLTNTNGGSDVYLIKTDENGNL